MSTFSIPHIRLVNQQLAGTQFKTPKEIVSWMGAMQAQDYNMAKWAIGTRLPDFTDKEVESALNKGEIIRTHILRPTWHFVAKEDIHWMLQLTGHRIKQALLNYDKNVGLSKTAVPKLVSLVLEILEGGDHLTRQELEDVLKEKGVKLIDSRVLNHIMFHAEVDGLVCSGAVKGKKQTYRLLDEITLRPKKFDKNTALENLACRFFTSHAPATLQDFMWWSGLSLTEARAGLEMIQKDFISEAVDGQTYWFNNGCRGFSVDKNVAHLLPAFDEYVVSYKDRRDIFEHGHYAKVINNFGTFKPTVMVNGQVVGMWKRAVKTKKIAAEVELFKPLNKAAKSALAEEIEKYEKYNMPD